MIESKEQKDEIERVCRGPHVYHWHIDNRGPRIAGSGRVLCGQIYGAGTVREFVNCRKCLRAFGDQ